jgi:DNA repair exonuclease SbcCD ATPase subunit
LILNEIELKGFGSYRDQNIISIPVGLTGIVGVYEENSLKSIGSGKSTLVTALNYILFGKGEFDKIEELLNDQLGEKDEFFAGCKFQQGDSSFYVKRGRNGSSYLELTENGSPRGEPKIDVRTEEIKKIVGMDYDMFTASVFFEQDRLSKLIDTDPSVRRNYVEKVLGTSLWTAGSKLITKDKNTAKKDADFIESEIIKIDLAISEHLKTIEVEETIKAQLAILTKDKKDIDGQLASLDFIKSKKDKLCDLENQQNKLFIKLTDYSNKLEAHQQKSKSILESVDAEKKSLAEIKCELSLLYKQREEKENELEAAKNEESFVQEMLNSIFQKLTKDDAQKISLLSSKLDDASGICPTCNQPITIDCIKNKNKEIDKAIKDLQKLIDISLHAQKETENKKQEIVDKIELIETALKQLSKRETGLVDRISTIEANLAGSTAFLESAVVIEEEYKSTTSSTQEQYNNIEKDIEEITKEIASQEDKLTKYEELKKQQLTLSSSITDLTLELGKIVHIKEDIKRLEEEKKEKEAVLSITQYSVNILKALEEEFDTIPSEILTSSVYQIEKEASDIIHNFMPEMNVFVREDTSKVNKPLQIFFEVEGKRRNYKRLSGGQKTIANLALRLGFSKVISSRVGAHINFLILDEPFGYLDSYTRDLIKKVLTEINKWFKQIIVISHVDNIQDFPNIIKIVMSQDGISRIQT